MTFTLEAAPRTGQAEAVRSSGAIPAVVYGPEMDAISVSVPYHTFETLYRQAGESSLLDFTIAGDTRRLKVLIQDVAYDPVTSRMIHIDFRQINMKKEMQASVALFFISESPAVKGLGGTLVKALSDVRIKCLPNDLIGQIDIDLSALKTFDDVIRVSDLVVPAGVTILDNPETTVAKVAAPLTEDQIKAMEEEGVKSLEEIEVEKKGKEEEPAEEGEAEAEAPEAKKE